MFGWLSVERGGGWRGTDVREGRERKGEQDGSQSGRGSVVEENSDFGY